MRVQNPNIDLRSKTVNVTRAQLLALVTTPITLVPAPGAGRIVSVFGIDVLFKFGTIQYQVATGSIAFQYADAAHSAVVSALSADPVVGAASSFSYLPGTLTTPIAISPGADNTAVVIPAGPAYNAGPIVTATLGAGGAGYAIGDTGEIDDGGFDATYVVDTVDGAGAVLTFHLTATGSRYTVTNGAPTAVGGAQPGVGVGFTVNITAIRAGDGTLKVVTYYQIIPVP